MTARLGKLIRLLSSDQPGEVIAAANAITRELRASGSDIHRLAEVIERSPLVPRQPVLPEAPHTDDQSWRYVRGWCARHAEYLSEREYQFIASLAQWRWHPTEKQLNWLLAIERRIRKKQKP
jgi:hypothetical protein